MAKRWHTLHRRKQRAHTPQQEPVLGYEWWNDYYDDADDDFCDWDDDSAYYDDDDDFDDYEDEEWG